MSDRNVENLRNAKASYGPLQNEVRATRPHSELPSLWKQISYMTEQAGRDGKTERAKVLIEVMRLIVKTHSSSS